MLKNIADSLNVAPVYVEFASIILATILLFVVAHWVLGKLRSRFKNTRTLWDDAFTDSIQKPLLFLVLLLGVCMALSLPELGMAEVIIQAIPAVRKAAVIIAIAWFSVSFIRDAERNIVTQKKARNLPVDMAAIGAIGKVCRLIVFILATLIILQTFGFSVAGVLAFGGVGGIAIGFAAKDLLANFFGGLMIYLDRPFSVGDWIRSPDRELEGVVEEIGWRITRVKNFNNRPMYIPNSVFSVVTLENPTRMTNRKIYETISVRYDDAQVVLAIVDEVREYLSSHQGIDKNETLQVSLTTFGPSSLDFFIYCFTMATSGVPYYAVKQEILLHILQVIDSHGAECAFPTSTLYFATPPENLQTK